MKIIPFVGDEVFEPASIRIDVAPEDADRVKLMVTAARELDTIFDDSDEQAILNMRRSIKGLLNVIDKARESAKAPFLNAERAIQAKAGEFNSPLEREEKRLAKLMGDYAEEKRKTIESERRAQQAKIDEQRRLEEKRLAELQEFAKMSEPSAELKVAVLEQELAIELAQNTVIAEDKSVPLVAGGRSVRAPKFKLRSAKELWETNPKLAGSITETTLKLQICKEVVKQMLASGLTEQQVFIPGVDITFETSVGIQGTSQIV